MGGDEFVLVLPDAPQDVLTARIRAIEQSVAELGSSSFSAGFLGVSAGFACLPDDGLDAEGLLAVADKRMYEAKRERKLMRQSDSFSALRNLSLAGNPGKAAVQGGKV